MKVTKLSDSEIRDQLKLIQQQAEDKAKTFKDELARRAQEVYDLEQARLDVLDSWVCENVEDLLKFVPKHDRDWHSGTDLTMPIDKQDEQLIWYEEYPDMKCPRCALLRIKHFGFKEHVLVLSVEPREK